jgi:adenylylsulfate kinase
MMGSSSNDEDGKLKTVDVGKSTNIRYHEGSVNRNTREEILNQRGCIVWMTGLSGSGKSTIAYTLEHALVNAGKLCMVLDGDNVRTGLNSNLGFSTEDRTENIRRIAEVAKLFSSAGVITIVSFISPYERDRSLARGINPPDRQDFIECFLDIPIEVCEKRDPKGLYKKARAGMIKGFTGIDDPYEKPQNPEITITTHDKEGKQLSPGEIAQVLYKFLDDSGFLGPVRKMPWQE